MDDFDLFLFGDKDDLDGKERETDFLEEYAENEETPNEVDDSIIMGDIPQIRILAVDDNPQIVRSIKQILGKDFDVLLATSGEKALEILEKNKVELILLDYEMPGMGGLETFDEIKKNPRLARIPIIFLTGVSDRQRIVQAVTKKPAGYLLKPIDAKVLVDTINSILWKIGG